MPSGDVQRVWYPEMLEELLRSWSSTMSWAELKALCSRMMEHRRAIRLERGIVPARMRCRWCGAVHSQDISGISIRSALFALKTAGSISEVELKSLDKSWRGHRARFGLDAYGTPLAEKRRRAVDTAGVLAASPAGMRVRCPAIRIIPPGVGSWRPWWSGLDRRACSITIARLEILALVRVGRTHVGEFGVPSRSVSRSVRSANGGPNGAAGLHWADR